ncbi:MAG TPA: methionyl-tRNA formyltransferase [Candidatus Acidoferrales bacterium]|nr:methionyl-tRNA formyltransferase [Candidatus Acidoferrales bacterium]
MALRIVFCGTPAFGLPALKRILAEPDFSVEAVITQPDRPSGRGQKTASSPVKDAALNAGIHVFQPEKIRSDSARQFLERLAPDAVVIIAYGQIISKDLLQIPRLGWINLHASLLPKYRGAAPIQRAILNGDTRTGLTTIRIDAGLDTGRILQQIEMDIGADETAPELSARMAEAGAPLMLETLRKLARGEVSPVPQDNSRATLAPPLKKSEGLIEWSLPAPKIYNQIRALDPWPGAYTHFRDKTCHIWGRSVESPQDSVRGEPGAILADKENIFIVCGGSSRLHLEFVKPEGRNRMTAREFSSGARFKPGERFAS